MLTLGFLAFIVAVALGAYRSFCKYLEVHIGILAGPSIWRKKQFHIFSWIIVAFLGLFSAYVLTVFLISSFPEIGLEFSFAAILAIRWLIALLIGRFLGQKNVKAYEKLLILKGLTVCRSKFREFVDAKRLLVVQLVGDIYFDKRDWAHAFTLARPPSEVDEIWLADRVWVTDLEQDWEYLQLYPVPSSSAASNDP